MGDFQVITRLPSGVSTVDAYIGGARVITSVVGPPGAGTAGPAGPVASVGGINHVGSDAPVFGPPRTPGSSYSGVARRAHTFEEAWGGSGYTDTSDFTAPVQELANWLSTNQHGGRIDADGTYRLTELTIPTGVVVRGGEGKTTSAYQSQIKPIVGVTDGSWLIRFASSATGAGLIGFNIAGGVTSGASPNVGGIKMPSGQKNSLVGLSMSGTSLGALDINGEAALLRDIIALNLYQWRSTLTTWEGTAWVKGSDHQIEFCQFNGGDKDNVYDGTNLYRCGLLLDAASSWVSATNGEFADCGIRVRGIWNHLDVRGDVNAGVGIYVDAAAYGNHFSTALVLSNSQGADGVYDGMVVAGTGNATDVVRIGTAANVAYLGLRMRYGYRDIASYASAEGYQVGANRLGGWIADPTAYTIDAVDLGAQTSQVSPTPGGSMQYRPPSRLAAGGRWRDTTGGVETYSDGTGWRDAGGETVGNVLDVNSAIGRTALSWGALLSTSTVAWADGHTHFGRPHCVKLTTTSTGVTAGYCGDASTAAFPVVAGRQYTPVTTALSNAGAGTVTILTDWYDVSNALLSTATSSALAIGTTKTAVAAATATAPTNATQAKFRYRFGRSGLTAGDTFEHTCNGLNTGTSAFFVEP